MTTDPPPIGEERRRCPVCWNWFTVPTNNPHRRYCSGACRVEDWRRRQEREHVQTMLDAKLTRIRESNRAAADQRAATNIRQALQQGRNNT